MGETFATYEMAIHIYQESERLESRQAFRSTVANFFARLLVASSFVVLAWLLPVSLIVPCGIAWGMALLGTLTYFVARHRGSPPLVEVGKHVGVAIVVIAVSKALGAFIMAHVS